MTPVIHSGSVREYARNVGRERTDCAWILSLLDSWERNPFYVGPLQTHPEDDYANADIDEDGWTDELERDMLTAWDEIPS